MDNNQKNNICYVFSSKTFEIALEEWLESMTKTDSKNEEKFKIAGAALPWFLEHIQENASIYMFTNKDLEEEIEIWKDIQCESFANQKKRIEETGKLIIEFFHSDIIKQHKMVVEA